MEEETFKCGQQQNYDLVVSSKQILTPDAAVLSSCSADSHVGRNALFTSTSQSESLVECSNNADVASCKNNIYKNLPDSEPCISSNGRVVAVETECFANFEDRTMFVPENMEAAVENPAAYEHISFTGEKYRNKDIDTASAVSEIHTSSKDKNSGIATVTKHMNSGVEEPVRHSGLVSPTHINSEVQEPVTHGNLEAATSVKHTTSGVEHINSGAVTLHKKSIFHTAVCEAVVNSQPSSHDLPLATLTAPHVGSSLTQVQKEVDLKQDAGCCINPAVHSNPAAHAHIFGVENVADGRTEINYNLQEGSYEMSRTSEFRKEVESNITVCVGRDEISVDKSVTEQDGELAGYLALNNNSFHARNALRDDDSNIAGRTIISHVRGFEENGNSGSQPISQRKDVDINTDANVSISENDSSLKDKDILHKMSDLREDIETCKLGSSVSLNCRTSTSECQHVDSEMVCLLGLTIQNTVHPPVCEHFENSSLSYTEKFKRTSEDSVLCISRQQKPLVGSRSGGRDNVNDHLENHTCARVKKCDASISQEKCSVFGKDEKQSVSVGELNIMALDNFVSDENILGDVSKDNQNVKLCDSVKENNEDNCFKDGKIHVKDVAPRDERVYEKSTSVSMGTSDNKSDVNLNKLIDDEKIDVNVDKLKTANTENISLGNWNSSSIDDEKYGTNLNISASGEVGRSISSEKTGIHLNICVNNKIDTSLSTFGGCKKIDSRVCTSIGAEKTGNYLDTSVCDETLVTSLGTSVKTGTNSGISVGDEALDTNFGTVNREKIDSSVGSSTGDERNDTTLCDERNDTNVGDERNDTNVGDERNNTNVVDERNDTTVGDERNDTTVGDERNDTTVDDERNDTTVSDERNDTTVSIYISDGDDTNFSIYVSDGDDSVVDFITVSDAEEDAHDTPEVAARKLPKLMVILKRCDAGQTSFDNHGSDSSDSIPTSSLPQNNERSSDGSLIANSSNTSDTRSLNDSREENRDKTQLTDEENGLDNIVEMASQKSCISKYLQIARPFTSSNTARKKTTVARKKTTVAENKTNVARKKTTVAREKTSVYTKQFKPLHSSVYFNQNQKIKRNRYFNLRSLDVTRNLRSKTRTSHTHEKPDLPSGDTVAQDKKKTSTKVKHKPPPESPPLNPTLPFLEVDLDIELDESQFFRPIDPALEDTHQAPPPPPQKKKRGRKPKGYKKDSTLSNSSEPSGSNAGEPSGSQFTVCNPGHSCCQKALTAQSDMATQWEDPSRWYAALEARANKAMPSHIKTEPGDDTGNLYIPQVTNLQGDQNYEQLNQQYLPEYSYQNTAQDIKMAASANLASNFTDYSYVPQGTNLQESQNYEQLNQQYLPAYSYQSTSQDIKMAAYAPLTSAFSEPSTVSGLRDTLLPADAEAIPGGHPQVQSSHLFQAASSGPVPVFLTAVHQTSQNFSNSLNSEYGQHPDIHSHSPDTHANNNHFNSWETSGHILENPASSTQDSLTKQNNSSHTLENSSSSNDNLHTKPKISSDIPENSASSTKDSHKKRKSSDIPENSSFTKDSHRKRKSSDFPESSPSSTKAAPKKRKKSSDFPESSPSSTKAAPKKRKKSSDFPESSTKTAPKKRKKSSITENSSSSTKDSHKVASRPDPSQKRTKPKKTDNTKGRLKKSQKDDDSVVIVIDDAASDSSSDGDVVCIE